MRNPLPVSEKSFEFLHEGDQTVFPPRPLYPDSGILEVSTFRGHFCQKRKQENVDQ